MPAGLCASGPLSRMQVNSACAPRALDAEDLVADLELGHVCTYCLDLSGELAAEDPPLRPQETGDEAADEVLGAAEPGSPSE